MNLAKKLLIALAVLKIAVLSQAMEEIKQQIKACKPVKMPSAQIIRQRLNKFAPDHFVENTGLDVQLGGQEKHPIEVLAIVKEALSDYELSVQDKQVANAMSLLKPDIMKAILQDSSEAVAAFEKFYSHQAKN